MTVKERKKRKHVGQCFKKSNLFQKNGMLSLILTCFVGEKGNKTKNNWGHVISQLKLTESNLEGSKICLNKRQE